MINLRHKIAQMLVMGFDGCTIDDKSPIAQWLSNDGLGGVILFDKTWATNAYGKNLKSQEQIKQLIAQLNAYAANADFCENQLPLLTTIDYEGGAVDRLSHVEGCMPTLTARELAKLPPAALLEELTQMALTLKSLGFNVNFAPVVDLNLVTDSGVIGKLHRSFSDEPETVMRIAKQFVSVFNQYGIACAYKHFPGHGSALGDTHEGFVDMSATFQAKELMPFRLLQEDNDKPLMVMTAHVVNTHLDNTGLPATLSYDILTGLLRKELGFEGVIISDDLQMHAIAQHYALDKALALTVNAGADMVIFGNQLGHHTAPEIIDCIEKLVLREHIPMQRIDDACRRVMRLKRQLSA